jgi:hypothetical protein
MRKRILLALLALLVVAGGIAYKVFRVGDLALIGSGYAAQQTCACMFVSGRAFENCQVDLEPLARKLISIKPGDAEVTASAWPIASATARYQKGLGCSLEN